MNLALLTITCQKKVIFAMLTIEPYSTNFNTSRLASANQDLLIQNVILSLQFDFKTCLFYNKPCFFVHKYCLCN